MGETAGLQLFDSSVLIPWLRSAEFDPWVARAIESRSFVLSSVVWMELYAGTRSRADKQDLDQMLRAMTGIGRVISPEPIDFYHAGQMIAYHSGRYGHLEGRAHTNDVLIALSAWRAGAELVSVNAQDMCRWQEIMRRSGKHLKLKLLSISPK